MNMTETELINWLRRDFSREVFVKASSAFLKKNLLIPINIRDECLCVITTAASNLEAMDDLKLVYPCKSVAGIELSKEGFVEIHVFVLDQMMQFEINKKEQIIEKIKPDQVEQNETLVRKKRTKQEINLGPGTIGVIFFGWCVFYILGIIIFLWSVGIAYYCSGLLGAIITFFLPFVGQLYWFIKIGSRFGFDQPYCVAMIFYIAIVTAATVVIAIGRNDAAKKMSCKFKCYHQ